MKSDLICNYLGVSSPSELVGYCYNHGNNSRFGIYRKSDIILLDCSMNEWQKWGRHPWEILPYAKKIESTEESQAWDLAGIGISFSEGIAFAAQLEDASDYAQTLPLHK